MSRIDHLVVVADTLAQGVAWCEATLGVVPGAGGRHALMATHNRLLKVGEPQWPDAYLEIIAIDPEADAPPADGRARWFGMDQPAVRAAVKVEPRLVHFVAQTSDARAACQALSALDEDVGRPVTASRATPHGDLRWEITLRDDGVPQHGGALPALIEWHSRHPSAEMAEQGVQLRGLTVHTVQPQVVQRAWSAIGLAGENLVIAAGPAALTRLDAVLSTPRGEVVLRGGGIDFGC